jgi:CcmD family protein
MDNSIYLFVAFSITWTVIFLYIFRLFLGQRDLNRQIYEIEKTLHKKSKPDDGSEYRASA